MGLHCKAHRLLTHGWLAGYNVVFNRKPTSGLISDDMAMYFDDVHIPKRRVRECINENLSIDWDSSIEKDLMLRYSLKGFYGAMTHYESDLKISEAMKVFSKTFKVEEKHLKDIDIWT